MAASSMTFRERLRLHAVAAVFLAGVGALLAKLWGMQIDRYEYYRQILPGAVDVTVRVPGVRGEIKDRNGITLVTNEPNYEVLFDLKAIVDEYRERHADLPTTVFRREDRNSIKRESDPIPDIVRIVEESVVPGLVDLGLAAPFNKNDLEAHYKGSAGILPWRYRDDLTFEEFATFAEHNLEIPGVSVSVRPKRRYLYGSLAAHVLGYVSEVKPGDVPLEERKKFRYYVADAKGIAGVELSMDAALRAPNGKSTVRKDEKGRLVGEVGHEPPGRGADVYLTIDARVQYITELALRESGAGRAAAVVIQPSSGDVLAMASVPSFDPNYFIPSIASEDWERYVSDPTNPLVNRAIKDFPPGSTFKIPIALAGCFAGVGGRTLYCNGGQQYGAKFMRCWIYDKNGSHGPLRLDEAIMRSCNDYFYQFGEFTGIQNIRSVCAMLGLGSATGIQLDGENDGAVPDPDARRVMLGESWSGAQTAMVSIGQGLMEATPLQMASVAATVGAGGVKRSPQLVYRVVDPDGADRELFRPQPIDLEREGFDPAHIDLVRSGMRRVIHDPAGTAKVAARDDYETGGKTGTAQDFRTDPETKLRVKDNRAWFICFAPFDQPEVAVCVMVANGRAGGAVAAPIAARIVEESLALNGTGSSPPRQLAFLPEAPGSFVYLEEVDYDGVLPVGSLLAEAEGGETGDEIDVGSVRPAPAGAGAGGAAAPVAQPTVRGPGDSVPRAIPVSRARVRFKPADGEVRRARVVAPSESVRRSR